MYTKKLFLGTLICLVMLGLTWIGCSNEPDSTILYTSAPGVGSVAQFFPLTTGYTTTYNINNGDGTSGTMTFKVGGKDIINGKSVTEWISYGENGLDTSWFEMTDSALYYYSSLRSNPEKILELPLTPGNTWARYSQSQNDTYDNDYNDIITDYRYDKFSDTTKDNGGTVSKTFPTTGANTMTVEGWEEITLSNGDFYSRAIRVSNKGAAGTTNYYWYVAGVGLVKYVIGASGEAYSHGDVVGELVLYGF